ncbi:type IV toxin-antitoxin system AbiEi family antitoxin [Microbacterium pumilum]|uniref:AbiEi antitoxin C-terminal domain-containing protein n=1 Tax=Microbacterium pumilum TaxID=344165 RepID=A0ABN2SLP2_9MICO
MASPFLYFVDDRLSQAELSAACLDGDLVGLGDAYIPADAVETSALRAGSLAGILGDTLAATHLTAAWIHGVLPAQPPRHTVQRAVARRLHRIPDRRLVYRDLSVDPADLVRIGGVWVTTPARTLADLSRVDDPEHARAVVLFGVNDPGSVDRAIEWLTAHPRLPHKRAGLRVLRRCALDQDVVTR